jgi:hypothetical protein
MSKVSFEEDSCATGMAHATPPPPRRKAQYKLEWMKKTTKRFIVDTLLRKKWTSQSRHALNRMMIRDLRKKLKHVIAQYASPAEVQKLQDTVIRMQTLKTKARVRRIKKDKQNREKILKRGQREFAVGETVYVFDEMVVGEGKDGTPLKQFLPIRSRVIRVENEGRHIWIEFRKTRQWYEAGGAWIYKGQQVLFKFESSTLKWLRDGLTAEVVRSFGEDGRSVYFRLPHTRQYLVWRDEV